MLAFTLRRLVQAVPVVFLSTVAVFLLLHLVPGDPALAVAGSDAREDTLAAIRQEIGLDHPLRVQYLRWVGRVVQGDLERSYTTRFSVAEQIWLRIPATPELSLAGIVLVLLISIPTGVVVPARSLVTGASGGVGWGVTRWLPAAEVNVIACSRDEARADLLASDLGTEHL